MRWPNSCPETSHSLSLLSVLYLRCFGYGSPSSRRFSIFSYLCTLCACCPRPSLFACSLSFSYLSGWALPPLSLCSLSFFQVSSSHVCFVAPGICLTSSQIHISKTGYRRLKSDKWFYGGLGGCRSASFYDPDLSIKEVWILHWIHFTMRSIPFSVLSLHTHIHILLHSLEPPVFSQ